MDLKHILSSNLDNDLQKQKFKGEEQDQTLKGINIDKARMEMNDEKALRDPNSDISKLTKLEYINSYKSIGANDIANKIEQTPASAYLLKTAYGSTNINNKIQQYLANQNRLDIAKARAEDRKLQFDQKLDNRKQDFITNQYNKLTQSKPYQAMYTIAQAKQRIDDAINNPSGVKDVMALYDMIKSFDPGSVVKEGELKLFDQAKSIWSKAGSSISKLGANPRVLDKKLLIDIKKAMDKIYTTTKNQYDIHAAPLHKMAKSRGITEEDLSMIDPLYEQMSQSEKTEPKYTPQQENGIKAVMDHNNISREEAIKALKAAGKL